MAKVKLDIEADYSTVTTGLAQGEKLIAESGVVINKFGDDAKAAYMEAWKEANKYNKELNTATNQTKTLDKETKNLNKSVSYVQQLKKEMKFYTSEALKAGEGTKAFTENLEKAGKLKDELEDINKAVGALNGNMGENFARAAGNSIGLVSRGYEGLIALQTLAGEKNEEFEKTIAKLQSLNAIANIAKEFGGIKDTLTEIKLGFAPVLNLYTKGNEGLKTFYRNFRDGKKDISQNKSLLTSFSDGVKGFVTSGISGIKSLWAVLRANPLGVILTVIGLVITAMVALKDKIKPIGALFNALGKTVDALLSPFVKLAEIMGLIADQSERRARATIDSTEKEITALKKRYDFEIALLEIAGKRTAKAEEEKYQATKKRLQDTKNALDNMLGSEQTKEDVERLTKVYEELEDLEKDRTLFLAKEQKDRFDYDVEVYEAADRVRIAAIKDEEKREIETALAKRRLALKEAHDKLSLLYDETEIVEVQQNVNKSIYENTALEINEIQKKYAEKRLEEARKNREKLLQLEKEFQDAFLEILRKVDATKTARLTGEARIEADTEIQREELELLRKNLIAKGQAEEDFEAQIQKRKAKHFQLTADQQEQFDILEAMLFEEQTQKLIALEVERQNELARIKTAATKQTLSTLETQESADILAVQGTPRPEGMAFGSKEEIQFEEQKQIAILNIQKEYADKKLELKKASLAAEREELIKGYNGELAIVGNGEDAETQKKREEVLKRVDLTEKQFIAQQAETDAAYKAELASIDEQLAKLNAKKQFSLAALLGITENDLNNIQTAMASLQAAFDTILNDVIAQKDAEIAASEEKRNTYLQDIEELENKVQTEDDLNQKGKANNKARIIQEIADKEELAAKELDLQRKALEEKKKAQKQKLLLDSITEASNLTVAASEILAATAGGGPVGVAIGVITIAAMFAAFAAAKASALKAIEAQTVEQGQQGFKEGVIDLQGPGTTTSDSIPANLSRGESVMTAKETKQYKPLFKAIRYNNKALIDKELMNLLEGTNVTLPKNLPGLLATKKNQVKEGELTIHVNNNYGDFKKEQEITNKKLSDLIEANKHKVYRNQNGDLVQKINSHTIITRKG